MKKTMLVLPILLVSLYGNVVFATDTTPTLNGVIAATQTVETTQAPSNTSQNVATPKPVSGDIYSEIAGASNVNINNSKVKGATNAMQSVASIILTILVYIISIGIVGVTVLDIVYVTLPFTRFILNKNAQGGGAPSGGGMGDMSGGMGMSGMGMPGMGMQGMGMPGMGMQGMGMRGGRGMNSGMGMQGGGAPQGGISSIQLVSNGAINAVAMSQQPGPDGKFPSPLKLYAQQMWVLFVLTPILIVLATNGVLVDIGFGLGTLISTLLQSLAKGL